jgi:D-cysteine desulfhydrase
MPSPTASPLSPPLIPSSSRASLVRAPTPVEAIPGLSAPGCSLWVKRDDLTHEVYGGNKVRKLEHILEEARQAGATRLVTVGAVGSHHVLATTVFGRRAGFEVEAVLVPQPRTDHVIEVLRADHALGLRAFPVRSWGAAPVAVLARIVRGARLVPLGGSSVTGTMGYVDAGLELAAQVRAGLVPEPDACIVALGSGGTAAGLAVGFAVAGLRTKVVGVCVSTPPAVLRALVGHLARRCRSAVGPRARALPLRLEADDRFLGAGYGWPTPEGLEAIACARGEAGLALDPTYTAKAFACALWWVRARRAKHVLYWHTLSSAPMDRLIAGDASEPPRELLSLATQ